MTNPAIDKWLASAPGKSMNPDGRYGLQCVDAVDQYAQDIFGVRWEDSVGGVGGANELLDRVPDEYWTRIDNNGSVDLIPQRGDVLVYGGDASNKWGHTAIVERADVLGVDVIQQDGFAVPHQFVDGKWYSAKPAHRARLGYSQPGTGYLIGWLRPKENKLPKIVVASSTIEVSTPLIEDETVNHLSKEQQQQMYRWLENLHNDFRQGIDGVQTDGDSFNLLRRIGQALKVNVDETARKKKHGRRKAW